MLKLDGIAIDTFYQPVEEIGGDFMEAFFLDDKSLVATVADATGHVTHGAKCLYLFPNNTCDFSRVRSSCQVATRVNPIKIV